jgi:hypothetical protein
MNTFRAPVVIAGVASLIAAAAAYVVFFRAEPAADRAREVPAVRLGENKTAASSELPSANPRQAVGPASRVDGGAPTAADAPSQAGSAAVIATAPPPAGGKAAYQPGPSKYRNATNPRARTLLARVGADFDAETYWLNVINDPATPAKERADLIEDLNEDGISDPARPTRKDLPLINSRLALIERLLPSATDQVNAAAFREAHKDLVRMRDRLQE